MLNCVGFTFKVVINIKCRYKYCRNGGNIDKDKAIKENGNYYCPDCYKEKTLKQHIEEYYISNLPQTTLQILRKVINQLLYTNKYEAEYILFIVKKIHINKLKINNPFGLVSYCNEGRNIDEWKKYKTHNEYKNIKKEIIQFVDNEKVKFNFNINDKKMTDII